MLGRVHTSARMQCPRFPTPTRLGRVVQERKYLVPHRGRSHSWLCANGTRGCAQGGRRKRKASTAFVAEKSSENSHGGKASPPAVAKDALTVVGGDSGHSSPETKLWQWSRIAAETRVMFTMSLSIVSAQVGLMMLGIVDTMTVARYSEVALAGVSTGSSYCWLCHSAGYGALTLLDTLISQAIGAKDPTAVRLALQRGCLIALALSIVCGIATYHGGYVLASLGLEASIVESAAIYCKVVSFALLPQMLFTCFRRLLQATGKQHVLIPPIIIANVVNLVLNYVLVFGKFGFPEMGVAGSALTTFISSVLMLVLLLVYIWPSLVKDILPLSRQAIRLKVLARQFVLGLPLSAQSVLETAAFTFTALLMGRIGTEAAASHSVANSLAALTYMVSLGISTVASVRIGEAVGRGDMMNARRVAAVGASMSVSVMTVFLFLFILFPSQIVTVFAGTSVSTTVMVLSAALLPIAGLFQVFDGLAVVGEGVLRGLGDVNTSMITKLIAYWGIGFPSGIYLAFGRHMGPQGLWWGLLTSLALCSMILSTRIYFILRQDRVARLQLEKP
mmetsp:Transcript_13005/g.47527  ORF Transcript_13005/g.47527 Transcript_13005/m.47527 type:complete len:561 (+) Transcript_13005:125-1807(+)